MILNQVIRRAARYFPDQVATIHEGQRQSYREFQKRVTALAGGLQQLGIGRGDRVAIYLLNGPRFMETVLACFEIGAVLVPLNTRLATEELIFIINDAECVAIVADEALQPLAAKMRPQSPGVRHYIAINSAEGFINYEGLFDRRAELRPTPATSASDLVGLFYTSGTTGVPKGVMLSHHNLWMNAMHSLIALPHKPGEIYLHAAPMFHLADFPALINTTLTGGTHTFLKKFDPKAVLEAIERDRVTSIVLVPTMINFVINHPDVDKHDLSSLRRILYGASPMPVELLKQAMATLPGCEFYQGYGQSESSPLLTALTAAEHITEGPAHLVRRLASCGRAVIGVEVQVFNEQDQPVLPGEVGEIVARGPNVMMGYWKRPEETERALRGGWLRTGDMATVDEDGYIYIVDRKKDMIITGGENVYSTEVENAIYTHPAIHEAAVIGAPDGKWGEAVTAIITVKPGAQLTGAELIAHCAARLADYKVPKRVEIVEGELPKSGTGKILKKELRERYWRGYERRVN
jgi:long-chain acyl-CoA synthetase